MEVTQVGASWDVVAGFTCVLAFALWLCFELSFDSHIATQCQNTLVSLHRQHIERCNASEHDHRLRVCALLVNKLAGAPTH